MARSCQPKRSARRGARGAVGHQDRRECGDYEMRKSPAFRSHCELADCGFWRGVRPLGNRAICANSRALRCSARLCSSRCEPSLDFSHATSSPRGLGDNAAIARTGALRPPSRDPRSSGCSWAAAPDSLSRVSPKDPSAGLGCANQTGGADLRGPVATPRVRSPACFVRVSDALRGV
jgi:hypothetical protein